MLNYFKELPGGNAANSSQRCDDCGNWGLQFPDSGPLGETYATFEEGSVSPEVNCSEFSHKTLFLTGSRKNCLLNKKIIGLAKQ